MQLLDGKVAAAAIKEQIAVKVNTLKTQNLRVPHLAAILVGNNPASTAYVGNKVKTCAELGIQSSLFTYDESLTEKELLNKIAELNADENINGILVQLPLPKSINENNVINAIDPNKDVDGFHPINIGKMVVGQESFLPATPYGIMLMLQHYGISLSGKHTVVVGRSNIVGTPMSILLSRNNKYGNSTVTLCHSKTKNMQELLLQADVVVAAIGIPQFITANMVKPGAIIIDVGINKIDAPEKKSGSRLVGDVDFENLLEKVDAITPVPGGVGLMTIAGLMQNTLNACLLQQNLPLA